VSRYLVRRLLIAIPSLLGISVVLFTVLALAPGSDGSAATSCVLEKHADALAQGEFLVVSPGQIRIASRSRS
jgi:peptide/nickel transport system permease protein